MPNLTLEDIAKQAGVSRSTVSRVVNDHPNVKDDVRERVQRIIRQTGYQPHAAAQSLASKRSNVLGLVIPRSVHTVFTDPYFPRLTQGIAQACNQHGYTLSLFLLETLDEEQRIMSTITRPGFLDGLIVQSTFEEDTLITRLQQMGNLPVVIAGHPYSAAQVSFIDVDNIAGAYNATIHLLQTGYHRIATVTGALNSRPGIDRLAGYKKALTDRGIPVADELIAEGFFSEISGYYAAQRLLQHKPDAIFVASDIMAIGALRAIREAGLRIPNDVALVGYDDLPPALLAIPPLTTIRQPIRRFGIKAVEILLDIVENGNAPARRVVFDTELIIRESCGANKKR